MSERLIVGGALLLIGIALMIGSSRDRKPGAAWMIVLGAIFTMSGASSVAGEMRFGPGRTAVLVLWPVVTMVCAFMAFRALKRAAREVDKPRQVR